MVGTKRLIMVAMVVLVSSVSYAQQLFYEDFTDGSLDVVTAGNAYADGNNYSASFFDATGHGVNTAYGYSAADKNIWDTDLKKAGWHYTPAGGLTVDFTTDNILFARIAYVSDTYDVSASNAVTKINCDLIGDRSGTNTTYYPCSYFRCSEEIHETLPAGNKLLSQNIMISSSASESEISSALDGIFTNTFVYRAGSTNGLSMTAEVSGAYGVAKGNYTSTSAMVMTKLTEIRPTIDAEPNDLLSSTVVYSTVSGQTNGSAPTAPENVKWGWVEYEVGQTVATDFNFDYSTTLADGQVWAAGRSAGISSGGTMSQGDANNDGAVTLADGQAWAAARAGGSSGLGNLDTGDYEPLIQYDATTGEVSIQADLGSINSIIVRLSSTDEYNGADLTMAGANLPDVAGVLDWSAEKEMEGATPTLAYMDPTFVGNNQANLTNGYGECVIAVLSTGLDASAFGDASVSFSDHGSVVYTGVTITPEPATMSLLAVGALALLRRKRA